MTIRSAVLTSITLFLSTSANAAIVSHGNLVSDDTSEIIEDIATGRQYLRFDTFNLSYADTIAAVSEGGSHDEWSIATSSISDEFVQSALGAGQNPCTGNHEVGIVCGTISSWNDSDFGFTHDLFHDFYWYMSNTSETEPLGLVRFESSGLISDFSVWGSLDHADYYGITIEPDLPVNALLYRDISMIPIPAAAWLFGSGLLGLFGIARRKKG